MALTKVTGQVIEPTTNVQVGIITATKFVGPTEASGTSGFTNINVTGLSTFAGNINANGNIVGDNSTNITGIAGVTATTLSGTLQTAAQTNITSVGTLSALTVSGNVNANGNIVGDNSTNITGIAGVTATTLAGTLQTAAQPNITSVGTLSSLNVSGNISVGGTLTYEDVTNVDSLGIITARSGVSVTGGSVDINEKIKHLGDLDTFISFPANDTFSVETAGQQNVQVDGTRVLLKSPSGTNTTVRLQHQGNSGYGDIILDRTVNAFIIDNDPSNASNNQSYFSVKNKGVENIRIDSSGNITSNMGSTAITSGYNYELRHSAAYAVKISNAGNSKHIRIGSADPEISATGGSFDIRTTDSNDLKFRTNNQERLVIKNDGAVIIGDTSTGNAFVGGDSLVIGNTLSGTRTGVTLVSESGQDGGLYFSDGGSSGNAYVQGQIVYSHVTNSLLLYTATTSRIVIDSNGRIGVCGYGAPDTAVSIKLTGQATDGTDDSSDWGAAGIVNLYNTDGGTTDSEVLLLGSQTSGVGQLSSGFGFGRESSGNWGTYISFKTHETGTSNIDAITERMRINSNGDLLINRPSEDSGRITIKGTNNSGSTCYSVTNSGKAKEGIDITCTTVGDGNFGGGISFGCGGNGRSGIAAFQSGSDDDINGLVFFTHGSNNGSDNTVERFRISENGLVYPVPNGGGCIMGTWKYRQHNQSQNYEHVIRGPYGNSIHTDMDGNAFFYIEVAVVGTGTGQAWCEYHCNWNSSEQGATLTHVRGNSGASSNRPYMVLNSNQPYWKMNHSGGYYMDIKVRMMGGKENVTYPTQNTFTSNP